MRTTRRRQQTEHSMNQDLQPTAADYAYYLELVQLHGLFWTE